MYRTALVLSIALITFQTQTLSVTGKTIVSRKSKVDLSAERKQLFDSAKKIHEARADLTSYLDTFSRSQKWDSYIETIRLLERSSYPMNISDRTIDLLFLYDDMVDERDRAIVKKNILTYFEYNEGDLGTVIKYVNSSAPLESSPALAQTANQIKSESRNILEAIESIKQKLKSA